MELLQAEFPDKVDFDHVKHGWWVHEGKEPMGRRIYCDLRPFFDPHVQSTWHLFEAHADPSTHPFPGEYAFEPKALIARAAKLRRWIKARPEKEVVLVAHGFFNHFLTGDVKQDGEQTTPWWNEAELRTFTFVDGSSQEDSHAFVGGDSTVEGEDGAMIKETEESLQRLGQRRQSVVRNINRPAERRKSLVNYKADNEVN